jgi:hypothetical protein
MKQIAERTEKGSSAELECLNPEMAEKEAESSGQVAGVVK